MQIGSDKGAYLLGRSALSLGILVFVFAQQLWIQLGTVVGIKTIAAIKCLMDGLDCLLDAVFAIMPFVAPGDCHGLPPEHFSVFLVALPHPSRSTPSHVNTSQSQASWYPWQSLLSSSVIRVDLSLICLEYPSQLTSPKLGFEFVR